MKAPLLWFGFVGLLLVGAPAASAGPGDVLVIQGNKVNVRQQPNTSAPVVVQLERGHLLVELQRQDDWVNVGIDGMDTLAGWVHSSLVGPGAATATAGAAAEVEGAGLSDAAADAADPRVAAFRKGVIALNAKAYKASGANRFTGVSGLGDGIVRVTATETWVSEAEAEKIRDMDALFDLWDKAEGTGLPIMVQVVDGDGHVVMTRTRR